MPSPSKVAASWETTDLGTAAFVHMKGLEILGSTRSGQGGRFVFRFADPKKLGPGLAVEYLNSESRKFDSAVRSLKKLCYDTPQRRH